MNKDNNTCSLHPKEELIEAIDNITELEHQFPLNIIIRGKEFNCNVIGGFRGMRSVAERSDNENIIPAYDMARNDFAFLSDVKALLDEELKIKQLDLKNKQEEQEVEIKKELGTIPVTMRNLEREKGIKVTDKEIEGRQLSNEDILNLKSKYRKGNRILESEIFVLECQRDRLVGKMKVLQWMKDIAIAELTGKEIGNGKM